MPGLRQAGTSLNPHGDSPAASSPAAATRGELPAAHSPVAATHDNSPAASSPAAATRGELPAAHSPVAATHDNSPTAIPPAAPPRGDETDLALDQALLRRRVLAWSLSSLTLALTVGFFATMTLAAPQLSSIVLGHYITLANTLAVSLIALFLLSIAVFSRHAAHTDALLHNCARPHHFTSDPNSTNPRDPITAHNSPSPYNSTATPKSTAAHNPAPAPNSTRPGQGQ